MNTYSVGTRVFLDFALSGKPSGVVTRVIEPGCSKSATQGRIEVRITRNVGAPAYRKGELLVVTACEAVPKQQEFRKGGSFFRWVNTDYAFA